MALAAVHCFALVLLVQLVQLVQLNAEEIPRWTLNLEYDGDFDLEPQAAYDACKAGTCLGHVWDMRHGTLWSCVDRYGLMNNMYLSGIFPGHESLDIMSHLICDFCVLSE